MSVTLHAVVLSASLSTAFAYGIKARDTPTYQRMVTKTLAISLVAVLAALSKGPRLLVAALAFGAVGDAFLAWDGDIAFLGGLSNFLASHLFYIALFIQNGHGTEIALSQSPRTFIGISMIIFTPAMILVLMPKVDPFMRLPVIMYSAAILGMVLTALTMDNTRVIVGGIMFTMSDTILAAGKFLVSDASPHRAWMDYMVWILYYSGQLLIALGTLESKSGLLTNGKIYL
ncbi:YhhN-like protein-domain-containing protein [Mariannaea sp. PMI_226]|nr:YhhN-like protein-domain-containing protein [Mariannaea sp. PMI_226]